jgi:hypothetical protein
LAKRSSASTRRAEGKPLHAAGSQNVATDPSDQLWMEFS